MCSSHHDGFVLVRYAAGAVQPGTAHGVGGALIDGSPR